MGKHCGPLARTRAVEVACVCHPGKGPSVTAWAGNQVSGRQRNPWHMKWDLEQGPLGGDGGGLPSQTASPDSGNSNDQSILG